MSANSTNDRVCPVSLNTKQEILNNGRKVFYVGKQFYDADQLKKWIDCGHTTFPHNRQEISVKHINELYSTLYEGVDFNKNNVPNLNLDHIGQIPDTIYFDGQSVKQVLMEALIIAFTNPNEIKYQEGGLDVETIDMNVFRHTYLPTLKNQTIECVLRTPNKLYQCINPFLYYNNFEGNPKRARCIKTNSTCKGFIQTGVGRVENKTHSCRPNLFCGSKQILQSTG